jgi:predicted RND superfamily exporter protein
VNPVERFAEIVTDHSSLAIVVMVLLTAALGAGAPLVGESSSLDQFQSESTASQKLDYIESNFSRGDVNTTSAQVIVRDDNVLDRESLLAILQYQQAIRDRATINESLTGDRPTVSIANVVATAAIRQEQARELRSTGREFEALNASVRQERAAIQQEGTALKRRADALNATAGLLRQELTYLRQNPEASVDAAFDRVREDSNMSLGEDDRKTFHRAAGALRQAETEEEVQQAYTLGTQGVLEEEYENLSERQAALDERTTALQEDVDRLEALGEALKRQQAALEAASSPSLDRQVETLESMNASEVAAVVGLVLADDGGSNDAFAFMPTGYEPGTTSANATMILVTQQSTVASAGSGAASEEVVDAQLAMQDVASEQSDGQEYLVFGPGVIDDEISRSQSDSMGIVGPLAMVFVLLALAIAYRDVLDILLGLVGIVVVLLWTFGFMGWAGIDFNQIFIAVPVLLIGLSIDYAIHIFMRHREGREVGTTPDGASGPGPREREVADGDDPREAMTVALGGVGVALVWVTATTVIGFLSNLTSPVPPIREFGVVSSFGITAALLVFGVLTPAVKVELDELLERFGVDRQKRALGTRGGSLSEALSVGSMAAKRAPHVVIALALLVSVAGGAGGAQVDTAFDQSDFLAEDPPAWMEDLPEPVRPGDYTAKANLAYVNDNFVREDAQAQILVEGDVTDPDTLERLDEAEAAAGKKPVTKRLATGEADITSPLSVMESVAARNASFNATFQAADTDGDGVPDRNVQAVYDELYRVAPEEAGRVLHREDGEYRAVRMVVSVEGGASGEAITTQMRDVADGLDGRGLTATATGAAVLDKIVQDELLETVVQSLVITLVAVFAFLMVAYRITEGSATLGAVTLLPVVLSVTWILGTMYLLDIPFNVLTGMITSLTVGLGVAYSIHLSERYNLELERTGDVWDAMDRAVTGTGGALMGSAATTVGGFGVLVFAILPPLQQFGKITGLTIIYAFLASVLVLPSLLVVWTRYLGPETAREQLRESGGTEPDAVADDEEADAGDWRAADDEFVRATVVDADRPTGRRQTNVSHVTPGETVTVTVEVEAGDGRVVLQESLPGGEIAVAAVEPEPIDVGERDDEVFVAWEGPNRARLEYAAWVDEDVDAAGMTFEGTVLTPEAEAEVEGVDRIDLVGDIFERIVARGEVTHDDLRKARASLEDGEMTSEQYQRVYQAWLRWGDHDDTPALQSAGDD